jgi:hypothetical protein
LPGLVQLIVIQFNIVWLIGLLRILWWGNCPDLDRKHRLGHKCV